MNINSIGVDFGTTKTLVSYFNERVAKAQTIRLGRGRDAMPTSIYVGDGGQFFFGEDAEDELQVDPSRYCRAFKMKLGQAMPAILFVSEGQVVQFSAVDLCTLFFKHLKERVEQEVFMGQRVQRAVVTCPVIFSPQQREELKLAVERAGFAEVELLTEPEAAGYAFCQMCPSEAFKGTALVVDWGGGTLDMAAITRQGHDIVALRSHSAGAVDIGGEHFDDLLCLHAMAEILRVDHLDYRVEDGNKQYLLRKIMQETKELLSKRESKLIRLSCSQGVCSPIQLEKKQFDQMIEKSVHRATLMLKDIVQSLREEGKKIELLLLVGGSAQIPFIAQELEQSSQISCKKWQYSHEAVSLGAGLMASGYFNEGEKNHQSSESDVSQAKSVSQENDTQTTIIRDSKDTSHKKDNQDLALDYYRRAEDYEKRNNMIEAVKWYQKAAEQGHAEAQFYLGVCYDQGEGISQNASEAVKWYTKAAEQGYAEAQFYLGVCYAQGEGVSKNASEAVKWYTEAAEQGYAEAQFNLGLCYILGEGVSENVSEAVKCFQKAAEQGYAEAQNNLGLCYDQGCGVSQNASEAVKWYQKAAEQGHAAAQFNLGVAYAQGEVVSQNTSEAIKYLRLSAKHGFVLAALNLSYVLTGSEQKEAWGDYWKLKNYGPPMQANHDQYVGELSLSFPIGTMLVYQKKICEELYKNNPDELYRIIPPTILISNRGEKALCDCLLEIKFLDTGVHSTINLPTPIEPNEQRELDLEDYEIEWGNQITITLWSREVMISCISIDEVEMSTINSIPASSQMPLLMYWVPGFISGRVLRLESTSWRLDNVIVRKQSGGQAEISQIAARRQSYAELGRYQFNDEANLETNELFVVSCKDYQDMVAYIVD